MAVSYPEPGKCSGVDTKRRTTKQRTYKTAKSQNSEKQNGEQQKSDHNKTANITKQRSLQKSDKFFLVV